MPDLPAFVAVAVFAAIVVELYDVLRMLDSVRDDVEWPSPGAFGIGVILRLSVAAGAAAIAVWIGVACNVGTAALVGLAGGRFLEALRPVGATLANFGDGKAS